MREIELLRECRDLLEEVDRLISQIGSFEIDKTEFRVDEKEQLLVITINDSEGDVFTYKNAYEFLYEYILNMHSDNIQYLREQYEDMFDDMDVNDWIMKRGYIEYINLRIRKIYFRLQEISEMYNKIEKASKFYILNSLAFLKCEF